MEVSRLSSRCETPPGIDGPGVICDPGAAMYSSRMEDSPLAKESSWPGLTRCPSAIAAYIMTTKKSRK